MAKITQETVKAYFNRKQKGRRLLPDPHTAGGLLTHVIYNRAASLMADEDIKNVLDIGCNRGSIEVLFHSLYPKRAKETFIEGIDISEKAIERANELNLLNCNFRAYDGSELPYRSGSFDLVIMVEVIEHVIDKKALLDEICRVLRPSGKLFLTTPNPECSTLKIQLVLWKICRTLLRKPEPAKDEFICHKDLSVILSSSGFESGTGRLYFWPRLYIDLLEWGLIPPLPPKGLYFYQKAFLRLFDRKQLPEWLDKRCKWSLVGLLSKKGTSNRESS